MLFVRCNVQPGIDFYERFQANQHRCWTPGALDSLPEASRRSFLAAGDKGLRFDALLRAPLAQKARAALLIGAAAAKIAGQLDGALPLVNAGTLDGAIAHAFEHAAPGDTVLLALACASFRSIPQLRAILRRNLGKHLAQRPQNRRTDAWRKTSQNRLDSLRHRRGDGRIRRADAIQRVVDHGRSQPSLRLKLVFRRAPSWLLGPRRRRGDDGAQAHVHYRNYQTPCRRVRRYQAWPLMLLGGRVYFIEMARTSSPLAFRLKLVPGGFQPSGIASQARALVILPLQPSSSPWRGRAINKPKAIHARPRRAFAVGLA